jgi:hypothetical protein
MSVKRNVAVAGVVSCTVSSSCTVEAVPMEETRSYGRLGDMYLRRIRGAVVLSAAVGALAATATAVAEPAGAPGCRQLGALRSAFPDAAAIGFTTRERVARESLRAPIWPGTCGKWFTRYRRGPAEIEVSLTLYKTHRQALVALAEPLYGPVKDLANGARVRTSISLASVNGVFKTAAGVASVYRNVFISSLSIAKSPVPLVTQMRLHRGIHGRVHDL